MPVYPVCMCDVYKCVYHVQSQNLCDHWEQIRAAISATFSILIFVCLNEQMLNYLLILKIDY